MQFHKHFHTLNTFFPPQPSSSQGYSGVLFFFFFFPADCPDLTPSSADPRMGNAEIYQKVAPSD